MNIFKKVIISLVFALVVLPGASFGQYQFPMNPMLSYFKSADRYELCFNATVPMGYFQGVSRVTDGNYIGDTTIKRTMSSFGFGGSIGLSLPFKATGHISCWAATIHLGVNMNTWNDLNSTYGADGSLVAPTGDALTASTMQIHLPIGVDWKVGNDAICSQRLAFGASVGAGLMPQLNMTTISKGEGFQTGIGAGCTPFVRVEGAFRIGVVCKVRVMYNMGDISLIEVNRSIPGVTDGPFKIVNTSNLVASFVIMPFSGGWRETDWYNTHDTYNQHDRFN